MNERLAYTIAEAATACGVSEITIRRAIKNGSLVARYPTARPVIPAEELREWLDNSPSQPKAATA